MSMGIQIFDSNGTLTFDSSIENILVKIDEQSIAASSVGSGLTYTYSAYNGKKICAFMQNTDGNFSPNMNSIVIPSCRITYPSGTPTITVSFDNPSTSYPRSDSYLVVFYTGASQ